MRETWRSHMIISTTNVSTDSSSAAYKTITTTAHTVYTCIPLYHTTHVQYTHIHTHTHTHIQHTYTHTYTHTHTHRTVYSECLYTQTCMQCTYSFICAHWSDIKVHVDAQYMHINTHLNKHVHVRTHAHTHSWSSTTSHSSPEHLTPECKQLWTPHPPLFTHRESTSPCATKILNTI